MKSIMMKDMFLNQLNKKPFLECRDINSLREIHIFVWMFC